MSRTILALALASSVSALLPAKVPERVRSAPLASSTLLSMRSRPFMLESAPRSAETDVELPTISGVDGLLFQALATVCGRLMSDELDAVFKPVPENAEPDDKLDQPYQLKKRGGWTVDGDSAMDVFKSKLASYGTVIDGITDWHGECEAVVPPFAALVVQPPKKDGKASTAQAPTEAPSIRYRLLTERECCPPPAGLQAHPHLRLARISYDNRLAQRPRVLSHSL